MCVICHKTRVARLPSAETMKLMWDANPDGAGVMWRDRKKVHWVKGFMEFKDFSKWIEKYRTMLDDTECALHFRITTHGGTCDRNCHPFPVGGDCHALMGCAKCVLMHNGVLPITPRRNDYSDSAEYAMRAHESGDALKYIECTEEFVAVNNRLCVFAPRDRTLLVGNWSRYEDDGCDYSNLNFVPFVSQWRTSCNRTVFLPTTDMYHYNWQRNCWEDSFGNMVDVMDVDPRSLSDLDAKQYNDELNDSWYCGQSYTGV